MNQGAPVQYQNFLRAYPSSFMGKEELEKGNKVLLPASVLAAVSQGAMPHPLLFRINSMRTKSTTYVGVLEFTAPEDTCIIPLWVKFSKLNYLLLLAFQRNGINGGRIDQCFPCSCCTKS